MSKLLCFYAPKKEGGKETAEINRKIEPVIEKYGWLTEMYPKPSNLWIQKAVTLFSRFDRDGDGFLSDNDILVYVNSFTKYSGLSKGRALRFRDKTFSFWKLLNNGAKGVALEDFVKSRVPTGNDTNIEEMEKHLTDAATLMFYSIDTDEDGTVSLQELVLFFKCIDVKESFAREIFATLDIDKDRKIDRNEFIHAFNDFLHNEEESPCKALFGPLADFQVA